MGYCPAIKDECIEEDCAWYSDVNDNCALTAIAASLGWLSDCVDEECVKTSFRIVGDEDD